MVHLLISGKVLLPVQRLVSLTSLVLRLIYAPSLSQTTYFRRITRSASCADVNSNVLTVTVNPSLSNNTIAASQTICSGSTPAALTGSTPAGGNGTYTYAWK
ncbi:hypothetical protein [Chitinophaga pinensis]|uniref:Ig-like domain-containing protein n=1 Tax=Chitinophaga pinensis TaxID=79329 RepID=A0A5C6LMZ7_9BACT|nr:hypothetical protein [Chitinophaga pinensis]TWV96314.1 hypothetical protein FEF09_23395 [Chitinophaga pinensis]